MSRACIGEPVSWLRLERWHLGELGPGQAGAVEAHLAACAACRASADDLLADAGRELPPLPESLGRAQHRVDERGSSRTRSIWGARWLGLGGLGLALAAVVWGLAPVPEGEPAPFAPGRVAYKGGDAALDLVRERSGSVVHAPELFVLGDRFKVLFTCPAGESVAWDVVVYQGGTASFPLQGGRLTCGNGVALPGAFQLTEAAPAAVCVLFAEDGVDRARLADVSPDATQRVCQVLAPASEPAGAPPVRP